MAKDEKGRNFWPTTAGGVAIVILLLLLLNCLMPDCCAVTTPRITLTAVDSTLKSIALGMDAYAAKTGSFAASIDDLNRAECLHADYVKAARDHVSLNFGATEPTDWMAAYYFGPKARFPEFKDKVLVRYRNGTTELMGEEGFNER